MRSLIVLCALLSGVLPVRPAASGADWPLPPQLTRPAPITMAELAKCKTDDVAVVEVSDYVFGNYRGKFVSPPSADLNPKKAFIIVWKDFPFRFVFSHEASYCPWFELPGGAGVSYQFFEGNLGWAELFNQWGRQEQNSFVDIVEPGPHRVWVRWTYFGVNVDTGQRAYRATEDFWAYPNHFSTMGMDFFRLPDEVEEQGIYYSLYGVGGNDMEAIRAGPTAGWKRARRPLSNQKASQVYPRCCFRRSTVRIALVVFVRGS